MIIIFENMKTLSLRSHSMIDAQQYVRTAQTDTVGEN